MDGPAVPTSPRFRAELLPARMCNEFVYCPRLFHLEHVQGIFVESAETIEGTAQHDRAAKRGVRKRVAPPSPLPDPPWELPRTLEFVAPELGVTGKLDLVECEGDEVTVVEAKRGRAPHSEIHRWGEFEFALGVWPADLVQVGIYMAMLREHGFACTRARLYYRKSKTTREVPWSAELERFVHAVVREARTVERHPVPPPPLLDSPKCVGCSLHGICLPDEHHALLEAQDPSAPIRRIIPARDDKTIIHVTSPGTLVRKRGDSLVVCGRDQTKTTFPLKDVSHVALFGPSSITQPCTTHLLRSGVSISHHTSAGRLMGLTQALSTLNVSLRRAQYRAADDADKCLEAARAWTLAKIKNQRTVLRRYRKGVDVVAHEDAGGDLPTWAGGVTDEEQARRRATRSIVDGSLRAMKVALGAAVGADTLESLRGHEGDAAARYFAALPSILPPPWRSDFAGRSRRPPRDRINAMLSFGYALLVRDSSAALARVGLDPMLGLFHTMIPGRPALALDVMEPYRAAWVDAAILRLVAIGGICRAEFHMSPAGVALTDAGRKKVIRAYERRADELTTHPRFGYRLSIRRLLELDARLLGKWLLGETQQLQPFCTR